MKLLKDRLAFLLRESGKSQTELAAACGCKPPSVNDWLTGETKSLKLRTAVRAAAFFKVELLWLTEGRLPMRQDATSTSATHDIDRANYLTPTPLSADERIIIEAFRLFDSAMQRRWLLVARDEIKHKKPKSKDAA